MEKITERVIDSGNDLVRVPLNRWFCKNKRRKTKNQKPNNHFYPKKSSILSAIAEAD